MSALVSEFALLPRPSTDPFILQLLRDEIGVDTIVATPSGAKDLLPTLVSLVTAGFVMQGLGTGLLLVAFQGTTPLMGLVAAVQWSLAMSASFFIAIGTGLPGYWFHAVVLGVSPPAWRIAVELVRVQAIGTVVLSAVLPLWIAGCLAVWMLGGHVPGVLLTAGNTLPMLCALPGMLGLYRSFTRMATLRAEKLPGSSMNLRYRGRLAGLLLTGWWALAFVLTAPITFVRIFHWLSF